MDVTRIGLAGCGGRMGRLLVAEIGQTPRAQLAGGIDAAPSVIGRDLGTLAGGESLGLFATADPNDLLAASDVVIDFSVPAATSALAGSAAAAGIALVIGTTGLSAGQQAAIDAAARLVPVVQAANFSLGVNLLLALVERAAAALGPDYDIEILEMHHRMKRDAPSGTALALGGAAARARGAPLETLRSAARDGADLARIPGSIGFAALRGGDVVGDHTVILAASGERIELTHRATDRRIFARGAVRAALWVAGRPPGIYGMQEVLAG
jgi:4-hydroxy-tetrahydrodipicolinate reductase